MKTFRLVDGDFTSIFPDLGKTDGVWRVLFRASGMDDQSLDPADAATLVKALDRFSETELVMRIEDAIGRALCFSTL